VNKYLNIASDGLGGSIFSAENFGPLFLTVQENLEGGINISMIFVLGVQIFQYFWTGRNKSSGLLFCDKALSRKICERKKSRQTKDGLFEVQVVCTLPKQYIAT